MKKVIILAAAGILSFVAGTAGIYLAMPTIAPAVVDSTRVRLDSLGLLPLSPEDSVRRGLKEGPAPMTLPTDTSAAGFSADSSDSLRSAALPVIPEGTGQISVDDSLQRATNLLNNLRTDKSALLAQIEELTKKVAKLESQQAEAAELTKSLSKLEDRQLGEILAGLDLNVVEMLYLQASGRDRARLLQNLPPDRAARFVKTLVKAPGSANDVATQETTGTNTDTGDSNQ